jgi:6-pyruvoyltetrahydropterin/6-carboxytetrahydropterin synthase
MHGHTYSVELVLLDRVDERGFVMDYDDLDRVWSGVHAQIDHKVLNDVPGLAQPTTEILAFWIIGQIKDHELLRSIAFGSKLERVRVFESSTTWCEMLVSEAT